MCRANASVCFNSDVTRADLGEEGSRVSGWRESENVCVGACARMRRYVCVCACAHMHACMFFSVCVCV